MRRTDSSESQVNGLISHQLRMGSEGVPSRSLSPDHSSSGQRSSGRSDASRQSSRDLNFAFDEAANTKDLKSGLANGLQGALPSAASGSSTLPAGHVPKRVRLVSLCKSVVVRFTGVGRIMSRGSLQW